MNRLATFLAAALFAVITAQAAEARIRVVATLPDLAALARAVGGDKVEVEALARPDEDPHRVTATPAMVVRISRAQVFIENGLELEIGWVPALLQSARNAAVRPGGPGHVVAAHRLAAIDVPDGPVDRSQGDVHAGGNPHYTMDPVASKRAAWNIANGLIRVDPANREHYIERLQAFYARADAAAARAREALRPFGRIEVIVYHKHFSYMWRRLGIVEAGSIEPLPGIPPSAAHLARLIENHRGGRIRLVTVEPWNDRRVADRVARELGVRAVTLFGSVGGASGVDDIIDLFEKNTALVVAALQGGGR